MTTNAADNDGAEHRHAITDAERSLLEIISAMNESGGCTHRFDLRFAADAVHRLTGDGFDEAIRRLVDARLIKRIGSEYFTTARGEEVLCT